MTTSLNIFLEKKTTISKSFLVRKRFERYIKAPLQDYLKIFYLEMIENMITDISGDQSSSYLPSFQFVTKQIPINQSIDPKSKINQ